MRIRRQCGPFLAVRTSGEYNCRMRSRTTPIGDRERGESTSDERRIQPSEASKIDTSVGRFRWNVLSNGAYFVFNAGLQLWFVRYLIHHLTVESYGLIPLSLNVANYMSILTISLSGSVGRFVTADLARGDVEAANKTFNTALFASLRLVVWLVPLMVGAAIVVPMFLSVPVGQLEGTRFLMACTGTAFLVNTLSSVFASASFAKNRIDIQRTVDSLGLLAQVACVVGLFTFVEVEFWFAGLGVLAMALVRQIGYQASCRRLTPELRIRRRDYDRKRLGEILGLSGWLITSNVGGLLLTQTDLLITNLILGAAAAGLYAPVTQIMIVVRALSGTLSYALSPTLTAIYAQGDMARLTRVTLRSVKLLGLSVALPAGLVAGLSYGIMKSWLGMRFTDVAPFVSFCCVILTVNVAVQPIWAMFRAQNKLMWHGLTTLFFGVVGIGLAGVLAGPAAWGLWGIAVGTNVMAFVKNSLWTPWYAALLLNQRSTTVHWQLAYGGIAVVGVAGLSFGVDFILTRLASVATLPALVAATIACTLAYVAWLWRYVLDPQDLALVLGRSRGPRPLPAANQSR